MNLSLLALFSPKGLLARSPRRFLALGQVGRHCLLTAIGSLLLSSQVAFAGPFSINVNYQGSVPVAAQNAFNQLKGLYENLFVNPVTVKLDVRFVAADPNDNSGAASSTSFIEMTYANWRADRVATSALYPPNTYLSTSNGTLGVADPIGNGTVEVRTANARAIGVANAQVTGGTAGLLNPTYDSTLTFYYDNAGAITDEWDFTNAAVANRLNFKTFASHELNEALGIGSALTNLANNAANPAQFEAYDYFRYDSAGNRSITTNPSAAVYFTYDPTLATYPDRFNQDNNKGDRNDWIWGNFGGPAATVEVQSAIGYAGQVAPLINAFPVTSEFQALSTLGYSVPEPSSVLLLGLGGIGLLVRFRRQVK